MNGVRKQSSNIDIPITQHSALQLTRLLDENALFEACDFYHRIVVKDYIINNGIDGAKLINLTNGEFGQRIVEHTGYSWYKDSAVKVHDVFTKINDEKIGVIQNRSKYQIISLFLTNKEFDTETIIPIREKIVSYIYDQNIDGHKLLTMKVEKFVEDLIKVLDDTAEIKAAADKIYHSFFQISSIDTV